MSNLGNALRQIRLHPGASAIVIVMLALGIGATTAIFSLFHQVLLQPLPVPEPQRLVNLGAPGPTLIATTCSRIGDCQQVFSYPMFRDLEARQPVFSGLAAHRDFVASLATDDAARAGDGLLVSGAYFDVLGVRPVLGRLLGPDDERAIGESAVAVLSYDYWQSAFGGDPNVVGRRLTINGERLTIVGVAARGFRGTVLGMRAAVFVPITLRWRMEPQRPADQGDRRSAWVYLFARLAPGVTLEQASAGVNTLYAGILNDVEAPALAAFPADQVQRFRERKITVTSGATGQGVLWGNFEQPLTLLLGVTALVLLIVCVNVASLLLARGMSRAGELAIRASIGASRARLGAQLLGETAVLAACGGLLALPVAALTLQTLVVLLPGELARNLDVGLGSVALLFAAVASVATVLLFGTAPALQATRTSPGAAIKANAAQSVGSRGILRVRGALATAQIALSTVLLVLAGLFAQSLANVARVALGVDVESIVKFSLAPRLSGHDPASAMALFTALEERLAAEPGVTSVGAARIALLTGRQWGSLPAIAGRAPPNGANPANRSVTNEVSPAFFRTLGVPLLAGRVFTETDDANGPGVAIVNETFVRQFELGAAALGTRFDLGERARDIEIVGVVQDAKYSTVKGETPAQLFLPYRGDLNLDALTFYVRGTLDEGSLLALVPRVVAEIAPNVPVTNLLTLERQVQDNVFLDRIVTMLSSSLAVLATLLAAVGLYGALAYNVARRTRELGLRLAMGARPRDLRRMILRQVGRMALVGGAIGLVAAIAAGRAAESLLFGLSGYDAGVLSGAAIVLALIVLGAGYWPARQAARVEPMEALRYE